MSLKPVPTARPNITDEEWNLRVELATCYRAFVFYGWTDLIFTHLSARVPSAPDQYLINPYGLMFQEITPESLIKVDFDGNVIEGDYPYNQAGHAIHSAVLKARPDVNIALHSHTRAGMAVSCLECGVLPLSQQANEILHLVCYHDYDVASINEDECERLGRDLEDKFLMVMRNHGLLSVGRNMAEAFIYLYTLENACKVQLDVMAAGGEMIFPSEEARARLREESSEDPDDYASRAWAAVRRLVERNNPDLLTSRPGG